MLSASKSGSGLATGYNLTRSLRTRASASGYLSRTPSSAGNQKTWTISAWFKRGQLGVRQQLVTVGTGSGLYFYVNFNATDTLEINTYDSSVGTPIWQLITTQVFRDPSAWYHIVISTDTTQATAANRVKVYINGNQVTAFSTAVYPTLNYDTRYNANVTSWLNSYIGASSFYDGYTAEFNSVDGQALTPSSFGSTNTLTGVWQPARYTGTYGTNGFYLPFTDNSALTTSSNVGLGKDFSGNGNYWTTNNISITAGVTYDSMTDVPTLTSATAANYAVMNPIGGATTGITATISNGNLNAALSAPSSNIIAIPATIGVTSGSYYWEVTVVSTNSTYSFATAIGISTYAGNDNGTSFTNNCYFYCSKTGLLITNGSTSAYGASFTNGDVIGVAFNATTGTLTFYKNNTSQGAITGVTASTWFPKVGSNDGCTVAINFGQQPFTYTPPTGFVALNCYNLPTSTILAGNKVMDATLYTGTGANLTVTNTGGFKPDLVWVKGLSIAYDNKLTDSVRGATNALVSNTTAAETVDSTGLTSFNSNGFTLGVSGIYNNGTTTYDAWQWQAGQGSTSSNTNGSITSTVSVNASAGFSVVTYTGTGANATVGHGLGVAPQFIIVKARTQAYNWWVYHNSIGNTNYLILNTTDAAQSTVTGWNSTTPTSSVFSVGTALNTNASSASMLAYCWTPIAGFSAFGSYVGNGSADGPFIYLGFRPKWIMIKAITSGPNWEILDTSTNPINVASNNTFANLNNAQFTGYTFGDFVSNGIKIRDGSSGLITDRNSNGVTYIYAAFAENPLKNSLAR